MTEQKKEQKKPQVVERKHRKAPEDPFRGDVRDTHRVAPRDPLPPSPRPRPKDK